MPKYNFRIRRAGQADEVAELDFPSDAAALRDARLAIGDAIRDMALNRNTVATEQIDVRNPDGVLIGRVMTGDPDDI